MILYSTSCFYLTRARSEGIIVRKAGLAVCSRSYPERLPLDALRIDEGTVVDLTEAPLFRPHLRIDGIGLPGYSAGWFALRNEKEALVLLTRQTEVLYLPTSRRFSLLVSCERPDLLLAKLQEFRQ